MDELSHERRLADGRVAAIMPLTLGRARIVVINRHCALSLDDGW